MEVVTTRLRSAAAALHLKPEPAEFCASPNLLLRPWRPPSLLTSAAGGRQAVTCS